MSFTADASAEGAAPAVPFDHYPIPGTEVFPEGVVYDPRTRQLLTASFGKGALYRTTLEWQDFKEISPPGANGCASLMGGRMDHEPGRPWGKFTNGLAPAELGTAGPGATSPTLIYDVAVLDGDAYFTDSYHPVLFRLPQEAVDSGGDGELEPWLDFAGTVLHYQHGDGLASGLNLNGTVACPDGSNLIVVQTNTGKLFRITVSTKEVVEVVGAATAEATGCTSGTQKP
jgi:Cu-Zn family superoxide dismutase